MSSLANKEVQDGQQKKEKEHTEKENPHGLVAENGRGDQLPAADSEAADILQRDFPAVVIRRRPEDQRSQEEQENPHGLVAENGRGDQLPAAESEAADIPQRVPIDQPALISEWTAQGQEQGEQPAADFPQHDSPAVVIRRRPVPEEQEEYVHLSVEEFYIPEEHAR